MNDFTHSAPYPTRRNYRQRCEIHDTADAVKAQWEKALDAYDKADTDAEEARLDSLMDGLRDRLNALRTLEAALLLPESRSDWFRAFAASFPDADCARLSPKQAAIFERYGELTDPGRNVHTYQCRNSGRLFTLTTSGSVYYLRAETLTTI